MTDVAAEGGRITRRAPRWMWVSLVVSLSLNLLIAGVICGTIWAVKRGGYWDVPTMIERNARFMSYLPKERRGQIRAVFHRHKPALVPYWSEVRRARVAIGEMIGKGGYSEAEMKTAMDNLFQKEMKAREAAMPMIGDMLSKLTPPEKMHFLRVFVPYLDEAQSSAEVRIAE
jgi:uncharacterized membrane protein